MAISLLMFQDIEQNAKLCSVRLKNISKNSIKILLKIGIQ